MSGFATTTEGTGPGSVERFIPKIYNNQVKLENLLIQQEQLQNEFSPGRVDGGELKMLSALSDEDKKTILRAAEILKNIGG
jgi:hypothetical protein